VGVPVPGCELRIVGDDGAPMPEEEIGRLELTTPALALGYVGAEEHTGTFLLGAGGARWFRTADRFVRDRDGVFYHAGRVDDLFKVGGRWIAPDEIERTLLRHPAVWECAVVEGHDDDGLAQPVAYVVPNIDHTPSADLSGELMAYVKREIAPYKYPRRIHFVDGLPKDERGRLQRWRLARSARGASG
jgi:acyl-coenzyme A synthetase/AMP-(fatty) acid ligase